MMYAGPCCEPHSHLVDAGGELVGGCDLIMELDQSGELKQTLQEELAA